MSSTSKPRIVARRLDSASFAPFGDVVSADHGPGRDANQGSAKRFDFAARLDNRRDGARANLAVFRSAARSMPFEVRLLERHPCSSQLFVPMRCERFLVCVAPEGADGGPDPSRLEAFFGRAGQGVNYLPGVWHHPIVALEGDADLAMLAWEDGSALDCEERWFDEPLLVVEGDLTDSRHPASE
jgi:ureidoglycolate lyase